MAVVYWTPNLSSLVRDVNTPIYRNHYAMNILFKEPIPFFKYLYSIRKKEDSFLKCPAFTDYYKNAFVITAPFDFKIEVKNKKILFTSTKDNDRINTISEFLNFTSINRTHSQPQDSNPLLSLIPTYIFYSLEDINIEVRNFDFLDYNHNFTNIPGTFNIGKWVRPLDWTFEIKNTNMPVELKENDPLMLIKFYSNNNSKVELVRVEEDEDLKNAVFTATSIKEFHKKLTLNQIYKLGSSYFNFFKIKKKKQINKCPFKIFFKR